MENTTRQSRENKDEIKSNLQEVKEKVNQEGTNPVKEALKKELQPTTDADISPLTNNQQVGTTGGDQRASEQEVSQEVGTLENLIGKSGSGPGVVITEDPNEADSPIPVTEDEPAEDSPAPVYEPGGDGEPEKEPFERGEPESTNEIFERTKDPGFGM